MGVSHDSILSPCPRAPYVFSGLGYDRPALLPTLKLPFSFLWGCRSRTFHTLPQPDRLNIINTRGSIQRLSLLLSLVSGPASLHMTVSPCQEQPFSKGLRAVQFAFQGDGCCGTSQPRDQWILTASHFPAEYTTPYRVSKHVQGKQTCLNRGNVWPSLKCCFETGDDCWLLKNAQYVHKEKTTSNIKYSHFQVQKILQRWRAEADSLGEPLKQLNKFFT